MANADRPPRRPHVICHMMTSVDGRIVPARWPDLGDGRRDVDDAATAPAAWRLALLSFERRSDDMLGLRYRVESR